MNKPDRAEKTIPTGNLRIFRHIRPRCVSSPVRHSVGLRSIVHRRRETGLWGGGRCADSLYVDLGLMTGAGGLSVIAVHTCAQICVGCSQTLLTDRPCIWFRPTRISSKLNLWLEFWGNTGASPEGLVEGEGLSPSTKPSGFAPAFAQNSAGVKCGGEAPLPPGNGSGRGIGQILRMKWRISVNYEQYFLKICRTVCISVPHCKFWGSGPSVPPMIYVPAYVPPHTAVYLRAVGLLLSTPC